MRRRQSASGFSAAEEDTNDITSARTACVNPVTFTGILLLVLSCRFSGRFTGAMQKARTDFVVSRLIRRAEDMPGQESRHWGLLAVTRRNAETPRPIAR